MWVYLLIHACAFECKCVCVCVCGSDPLHVVAEWFWSAGVRFAPAQDQEGAAHLTGSGLGGGEGQAHLTWRGREVIQLSFCLLLKSRPLNALWCSDWSTTDLGGACHSHR